MAEHDYVIANQNGANTRSDLNNALAAIVSNNSKASAPTTTYAYMWWADTANDILKQRNGADSAWISILTLSTGAPLGALAASLVSGTHTNFTSTGIDDNATSTAITIDSSENVGIGTTTPSTELHVVGKSTVRNTVVSNFTLDGGVSVPNPYDGFGFGVNFQGRDYGDAIRDYAYVYSVMEATDSNAGGGDAGFTAGLRFYTNSGGASGTLPTEKLHINAAGDVKVNTGNLVIGTSGKGIDFSATSDGSGTMTSEVLDDYETGTFTPALKFGGANVGMTGTFTGEYVKVGGLVTVSGQLTLTAKGSSTGIVVVTGLPFVAGITAVVSFTNYKLSYNSMVWGQLFSSQFPMYEATTGGIRTSIDDTNFSADTSLSFSASYHI